MFGALARAKKRAQNRPQRAQILLPSRSMIFCRCLPSVLRSVLPFFVEKKASPPPNSRILMRFSFCRFLSRSRSRNAGEVKRNKHCTNQGQCQGRTQGSNGIAGLGRPPRRPDPLEEGQITTYWFGVALLTKIDAQIKRTSLGIIDPRLRGAIPSPILRGAMLLAKPKAKGSPETWRRSFSLYNNCRSCRSRSLVLCTPLSLSPSLSLPFSLSLSLSPSLSLSH